MAFFPPIPLIRKNHLLNKLRQCGATSETTARTLADAGVLRPHAFARVTEKMVRDQLLQRTADGRYYILSAGRR
jgi:hypothetical protein